jgi:hypothetical protein
LVVIQEKKQKKQKTLVLELWNHAGGLGKSVQLNRVKKTKSLTGPLTLVKRIEDKSGTGRRRKGGEKREV